MTDAKSNIVRLADYRKAGADFGAAEFKDFLEQKLAEIQNFEKWAYSIIREKHGLKFAENLKNFALDYEEELLCASDLLDKIIRKTAKAEKENYKNLYEECEKLIGRNERIKKNIVDDMASCRHYENKREFIKVLGFSLVTPVAAFNVVNVLYPGHGTAAWAVGIGGAALGTCVAFHHQAAELTSRAAKVAVSVPANIRKIRKATQKSFAAAAIGMSVVLKPVSEIQSFTRRQGMFKSKSIYVEREL